MGRGGRALAVSGGLALWDLPMPLRGRAAVEDCGRPERRLGLTAQDLAHLPFDGPVAPGTIPDEATERNWAATFELYRIIETQLAMAKHGIKWDPWETKT